MESLFLWYSAPCFFLTHRLEPARSAPELPGARARELVSLRGAGFSSGLQLWMARA